MVYRLNTDKREENPSMTSPRNPQNELPDYRYQKIQELTTSGGVVVSGGPTTVQKYYHPEGLDIKWRKKPEGIEGVVLLSSWNGFNYDLEVVKIQDGEIIGSEYPGQTAYPLEGSGCYMNGYYYFPALSAGPAIRIDDTDWYMEELQDSSYVPINASKISTDGTNIVAVDPYNDIIHYGSGQYLDPLTIAPSAIFHSVRKFPNRWMAVGSTTPISGMEIWTTTGGLTSSWTKVVPYSYIGLTGRASFFDVGFNKHPTSSPDYDSYPIYGTGEYTGDPTYEEFFKNHIFVYEPYEYDLRVMNSPFSFEVPNLSAGDSQRITAVTDLNSTIAVFPGRPGVVPAITQPSIQTDTNDRFLAYNKIGGWNVAVLRKNTNPNDVRLRIGRFDPDPVVEELPIKLGYTNADSKAVIVFKNQN